MNLLETGLPKELGGVPIYPDFRNMIRFELALQDERLTDAQKLSVGLGQLFERLPGTPEEALRLLLWFYFRGSPPAEEAPGAAKPAAPARAFDFEQDGGRIYAAFLQAYGIDLVQVEFLHWWAFLELLENLPDSTAMGQIMVWRTLELEHIRDKHQRAHYAALKARYALKGRRPQALTAAEAARRSKERVARRFRQAQQETGAQQKEGDDN